MSQPIKNKQIAFEVYNRLGLKYWKLLIPFKLKVTKAKIKKQKNSSVTYYQYVIRHNEDIYYTEPEKENHLIYFNLYKKLKWLYHELTSN